MKCMPETAARLWFRDGAKADEPCPRAVAWGTALGLVLCGLMAIAGSWMVG
jgi:hypothetical protein